MEGTSKRPVKLKFVSEIRDKNRKEYIAFQSEGQYYIKGQAAYLSFTEQQEIGDVKTIVKMQDDEVLIIRSGAVKMRQVFKKHQETAGVYTSKMGEMQMLTKTDNIEHKWKNATGKGKLFITYKLQLQGQKAGRYTINIDFKLV